MHSMWVESGHLSLDDLPAGSSLSVWNDWVVKRIAAELSTPEFIGILRNFRAGEDRP